MPVSLNWWCCRSAKRLLTFMCFNAHFVSEKTLVFQSYFNLPMRVRSKKSFNLLQSLGFVATVQLGFLLTACTKRTYDYGSQPLPIHQFYRQFITPCIYTYICCSYMGQISNFVHQTLYYLSLHLNQPLSNWTLFWSFSAVKSHAFHSLQKDSYIHFCSSCFKRPRPSKGLTHSLLF